MIADGQQAEEDPFGNVKTTAARYFGFYPTPDDAAERLFESFPVLRPADQTQLRFLEPNAGTGNLARRCVRTLADMDSWSASRKRWRNEYRYDNLVDCVEV